MDYATLVQNFIDRKIVRGHSTPERSYGNMSYRNDVLYTYRNPLVVRQKDTGIYFLNSDMVSNTTGRHIRTAIWSFRAAKVGLIEVSGGALDSILGKNNWSGWSGSRFNESVNEIELVESDELANAKQRLPENSIYLFKKEVMGETKTKYFRLTGQEIAAPSPEKGTYVYNSDIEFDCERYRKYNYSTKKVATNDEFFENFIKEKEEQGWMYSEARSLHLSSALVFRSKYRQFESLFDGDNGYSNDIAHKKWYYYYGGFDERQYFIAALPREVNGIEDALWSLKPEQVIAYENGKTAAMKPVLRQGEWFFIPSEFKIAKNRFKANALPDDGKKNNEHVCKHYSDNGKIYIQDTKVFHRNRGGRSTGEHAALKLDGQYMAYKNTELDSRSSFGKVD